MTDGDRDLLARLNALKPSSVNLQPGSPAIDVEVAEPISLEDKLAARLKGLRSGLAAGSTGPSPPSFGASSSSQPAPDVAGTDTASDWQQTDLDESSLEQLLDELGPDDQWKLDPDDPRDIEALLKEARTALPLEGEQPLDEQPEKVIDANENSSTAPIDRAKQTEDEQLEEEADDYVQRVLAELDVENKYDLKDPGGEADGDAAADSANSVNAFPSTPSSLPQATSTVEPPSYEDSELEARFSKLGLDLPSTPNTIPSSKSNARGHASAGGLKKANKKSNLPTYTNDDIDSWCCICNEDGEVRCLGCDGDIYCQNCWNEGHGTGPGQERGHRAVQYNRKPPTVPAAA